METSRVVIKISRLVVPGVQELTRLELLEPVELPNPLLANIESPDQVRVALRVLGFQIVEQPPAASDEHQEPPPGMMILGVCLEMFCQVVDALAENRDLNL